MPAAGFPNASASPLMEAKPTRTPVNEPGPDAAAKHVDLFQPDPIPSQQRLQMPVDRVGEAIGRMDRHLLDGLRAAHERDATVFLRGIERQYERSHWLS